VRVAGTEEREQREPRLADCDLPVLAVGRGDVAPAAGFPLDAREIRETVRDRRLGLGRAAVEVEGVRLRFPFAVLVGRVLPALLRSRRLAPSIVRSREATGAASASSTSPDPPDFGAEAATAFANFSTSRSPTCACGAAVGPSSERAGAATGVGGARRAT